DGIRDDLVTGVQTCALPIYPTSVSGEIVPAAPRGFVRRRVRDARGTSVHRREETIRSGRRTSPCPRTGRAGPGPRQTLLRRRPRSEERRVGKQAQSLRAPVL